MFLLFVASWLGELYTPCGSGPGGFTDCPALVTCFSAAAPGAPQVPFGSPGFLDLPFEILEVYRLTLRGSQVPFVPLAVLIRTFDPRGSPGAPGAPEGSVEVLSGSSWLARVKDLGMNVGNNCRHLTLRGTVFDVGTSESPLAFEICANSANTSCYIGSLKPNNLRLLGPRFADPPVIYSRNAGALIEQRKCRAAFDSRSPDVVVTTNSHRGSKVFNSYSLAMIVTTHYSNVSVFDSHSLNMIVTLDSHRNVNVFRSRSFGTVVTTHCRNNNALNSYSLDLIVTIDSHYVHSMLGHCFPASSNTLIALDEIDHNNVFDIMVTVQRI